jgi:iron complex transport system substrate-binding protein
MNKKIKLFAVLCISGWIGFSQTTLAAEKTSRSQNTKTEDQLRIISLGGGITEIIYALEAQQQLVAVDITSYWPKAAQLLPEVGYFRAISAEGILSLSPDLVLMTSEAGPPAALEQLRSVNTPMTIISADKTPEGVASKIQSIAVAINYPEQGRRLVKQVNADFKKLENLKTQTHTRPRVAFLFSVAKGNLLAAGSETAADAMIKLAAGENVFSEYTGYKPVNSEVLIAAAPDVLLLTDRVLNSIGGIEGVMNFPGVSLTPAGKNKRIIVMDTLYLLGFGPRTGKAALDLTQQLHPELMMDKNK